MINTSEGGHWYTRDGKPRHDAGLRDARKEGLLASVTTIDKGAFVNPGLDIYKTDQLLIAASENFKQPHESHDDYKQRIYDISRERAKAAAEFGDSIHDAIEHYPTPPAQAVLQPWFDRLAEWWIGNVAESVASESVITDLDIGVAGRLDRIVRLIEGSRRTVVDFKTQTVKQSKTGKKTPAFYDSWKRQLGFYAVCDAKTTGVFPDIPDCMSLVIDSNEGGLVYPKLWDKSEIVNAYQDFVCGAWLWHRSRDYWPVGEWSPYSGKVPLPKP